MIANLQYAIDYRPYILKKERNQKPAAAKKVGQIAEVNNDKQNNNLPKSAPQLLKANTDNVVNYMKTLANGVNDMKFSAKTLNRSITRFSTNYYKSDELVQEFIDEDVEELAKALNTSFKGKLSKGVTSENLNNYLGKLQQTISENMDILNDLGIDIVNGKAVVDSKPKNFNKIKKNASKYSEMLGQINETTNEMLSKSIYEQVKVQDLKLYVNYSFHGSKEKTFDLFNEGIILDLAI